MNTLKRNAAGSQPRLHKMKSSQGGLAALLSPRRLYLSSQGGFRLVVGLCKGTGFVGSMLLRGSRGLPLSWGGKIDWGI